MASEEQYKRLLGNTLAGPGAARYRSGERMMDYRAKFDSELRDIHTSFSEHFFGYGCDVSCLRHHESTMLWIAAQDLSNQLFRAPVGVIARRVDERTPK